MSDQQPTSNNRPQTEAEVQEDKRAQHFHRVFGRDGLERNTSQKFVVELLENVLKGQTFQQNPKTFEYDPYHAALREGERNMARAILMDIEREPVSKVTKPTVTK